MRVVSTVHKAGFDQYGEKWVAGVANWPTDTEFFLYTEGFDLDHKGINCKRIESIERAEAFKAKYKHYKAIAWRWDIVRFSNKVFASYDALYDYKGIAVWLDADAITYSKIPDGYIESLLPEGNYLASFKRIGWQTETGFWVMNCGHPAHKQFMDVWMQWLESGNFKGLNQWCDASTMDATVRIFERDGVIKTSSLSCGHEREEHPMSKVPLAKYIDHLKGESRKQDGVSPENQFRTDLKKEHGWWLPGHDDHMHLPMEDNNLMLNGRLSYQGAKQVLAVKRCDKFRNALDIGAHVGFWSFNMAKTFEKVYSFEPVKEHIECFKLNVTDENVQLFEVAVGSEHGHVSMSTTPGNSGDSFISGSGDIEMISIDSLGLEDVDFIKIDCQGYEEEVVKGAIETIKKCRPVIVVEQKEGNEGAKDILESIGYRVDKQMIGDLLMVPQ